MPLLPTLCVCENVECLQLKTYITEDFFKCSKPGHCFDNILESSEV